MISTREWSRLAEGLTQRLLALNMFVDDLYGEARVLRQDLRHQSSDVRRREAVPGSGQPAAVSPCDPNVDPHGAELDGR